MKLKKIVSLAMAGVLAVSMLAGCSNGTGSSSSTPTQEPAADDLSSKVIAELNDTTGVDFTAADSALQTALEKYAAFLGVDGTSTAATPTAGDLKTKFYTNEDVEAASMVSTYNGLPYVDEDGSDTYDTDATDGKVQNVLYVVTFKANDSNVNYLAKNVAAEVAKQTVCEKTGVTGMEKTLSQLPAKAGDNATGKYYYSFSYTGKIAVTSVLNDANVAASDQGTTYLVAFVITRTPTKNAL